MSFKNCMKAAAYVFIIILCIIGTAAAPILLGSLVAWLTHNDSLSTLAVFIGIALWPFLFAIVYWAWSNLDWMIS